MDKRSVILPSNIDINKNPILKKLREDTKKRQPRIVVDEAYRRRIIEQLEKNL